MDPSNLEESDLTGLEVCNFGGTEIALPIDLIEQVKHTKIGKNVFSKLNMPGGC